MKRLMLSTKLTVVLIITNFQDFTILHFRVKSNPDITSRPWLQYESSGTFVMSREKLLTKLRSY